MRKIKELAPKYSDAIRAMIDGLKKQSARNDFQIDMTTFGEFDIDSGICFGCAATCAIQQITGVEFKTKGIDDEDSRSDYSNIHVNDMLYFEYCIDSFRRGSDGSLKMFYNLQDVRFPYTDWHLATDNWQEELPKVEKYLEEVIKLGY